MNIMIDAIPLLFRRAGIGRYTFEILRQLSAAEEAPNIRLANFGFSPKGFLLPDSPTPVMLDKLISRRRYSAVAFHLLSKPIRPSLVAAQAAWAGTDVYFAPNYLGVYGKSFRTVVTVHDLVYRLFPQFTQPQMLKALTRDLPRQVERADRIVADSESTRRGLEDLLGVEPRRISVVPLAPPSEFRRVSDPEALHPIRERYRLPERFILFVGTVEPRKNFKVLFGGLTRLAAAGLPQKLVVVGAMGWNSEAEANRLRELASAGLALHLGYVPDAELPAIYSMAEAFVFPSWYEGFGIPPLEAMACGVPVICSNTSSLPEVCGEAAEYFDPHSEEELFARLREILTDEEKADRMQESGYRRAARYSWKRTAEELMDVFRAVTRVPDTPPASAPRTSPN